MQLQKHIYKIIFCKQKGGVKVCVYFYHKYCQSSSKDNIAIYIAFNNACKFLFPHILPKTV